MRRRLASLTSSLIGLACLALTSNAAEPLRHGSFVTPRNTGPIPGGFTAPSSYQGGQIKDAGSYGFARTVPATAVYDGFKVEGPHLLIENVRFESSLDISTAVPVVMRGVSVRVPSGSPWTILVRPGAGPVYFLWSEAGGDDAMGKPPASALDIRNAGSVVYRSHLSGTADGIDISGGHAHVVETLIDGLAAVEGSHNDGIQLASSANTVAITRSKVLNPNPQTSCLYLMGNEIAVTSSYLAGGGWTVYGGARNNGKGGGDATVRLTDTEFGVDFFAKSGHFGPVSYWGRSSNQVWKDNRFADGRRIAP